MKKVIKGWIHKDADAEELFIWENAIGPKLRLNGEISKSGSGLSSGDYNGRSYPKLVTITIEVDE